MWDEAQTDFPDVASLMRAQVLTASRRAPSKNGGLRCANPPFEPARLHQPTTTSLIWMTGDWSV
ncbi:hypothetical protein V1293_007078 [Bradyrhizobium sp. AZCC 1693]